jgi:hypothetical protein
MGSWVTDVVEALETELAAFELPDGCFDQRWYYFGAIRGFSGIQDLFPLNANEYWHIDHTSPPTRTDMRDGRIVVTNRIGLAAFVQTEYDHLFSCYDGCGLCTRSRWDELSALYQTVVTAVEHLETAPMARVLVVAEDRRHCAEMQAVTIAVGADIRRARRLPPPPQSCRAVPSVVLHDVMSVLHGTDRRRAGTVCKEWQRGACDPLLPLQRNDVTAWFQPRLDEMKRARPSFIPSSVAVVVAWALTRYWLQYW